jgi:signal recognition particle subunit SRP54
VLAQLGGNIAGALARMNKATVVDEKVLAECLNEISRALLQADVRFETVRDVKANIKTTANLDALAAGTDKRRIIQKVPSIACFFFPG